MKRTIAARGARKYIFVVYGFVLFEAYMAIAQTIDSRDFMACLIKSCFIGIFFFSASLGIRWARFALCTLLGLYSTLLILGSISPLNIPLIISAFYYAFAAIFVGIDKDIKYFFRIRCRRLSIHGRISEDGEVLPKRGYPTLVKRVQSTFIDGMLAFLIFCILCLVANLIDENSAMLKITAFIVAMSYEPIAIINSQTLGQRIAGISVLPIRGNRRLSIKIAYLRSISKLTFEWISFIVMFSNEKRRAIHDFASSTVVVLTR